MIKYSTKTIFKCSSESKSLFKDSVCSLTISVGQENHEGGKLYSTIEAVNNSFCRCNIMLCDTLQRHTMAICSDNSLEILYRESFDAGSNWIEINREILDQIKIENTLTRWDAWLDNPDFNKQKNKMLLHYQEDKKFKKAMDDTIHQFTERLLRRPSKSAYKKGGIFLSSFNYLIEECAVQLLWLSSDYEFEIYPSERNQILSYTYDKFIKPLRPDLLKPITLKFKKVSNKILETA